MCFPAKVLPVHSRFLKKSCPNNVTSQFVIEYKSSRSFSPVCVIFLPSRELIVSLTFLLSRKLVVLWHCEINLASASFDKVMLCYSPFVFNFLALMCFLLQNIVFVPWTFPAMKIKTAAPGVGLLFCNYECLKVANWNLVFWCLRGDFLCPLQKCVVPKTRLLN